TGGTTADISQSNSFIRTGSYCLRVQNRAAWTAGPAQYIDGFVKSGQQYLIEGYVYLPITSVNKNFRFSLITKGVNASAQQVDGPAVLVLVAGWRYVSATITAPAWSGTLDYAYIKVAGSDSLNTQDFYFDDFS